MSAKSEFIRLFESKFEDTFSDACCLHKRTNTKKENTESIETHKYDQCIPECLGIHMANATDSVSANLYAVYWGVKCGILDDRQVSKCLGIVKDIAPIYDDSFRILPNGSHTKCILPQYGLEIFVGMLKDSPIFCIEGRTMRFSDLEKDSTIVWTKTRSKKAGGYTCPTLQLYHIDNISNYEYTPVQIGNFVSENGNVYPITAFVCKASSNRWIEYIDRTGRLQRFGRGSVISEVNGSQSKSFLSSLILDAKAKSYDKITNKHVFSDTTKENIYKSTMMTIKKALVEKEKDGIYPTKLFVASLPGTSNDYMKEISKALIKVAYNHLINYSGVSDTAIEKFQNKLVSRT
ncbi:hypothetical protein TetV_253 [Tetraselmis virus 1]|uniref:Uncharacterized protein n=1 Tax=Tetraselmis virus 1 TaxID=2060617 RepID=A0A2P0VN60_9VIRU|nr:hypothetical protein QJ968_gp253 [Tetraselmis virus 1]AUF82345.1 hypothetical protein TetV_253 [Tetraselmis virus 1]